MKQYWNDKNGRWEPLTNYDYIKEMNARKLSEFLANTFCYGYGQQQILEWLEKEKD